MANVIKIDPCIHGAEVLYPAVVSSQPFTHRSFEAATRLPAGFEKPGDLRRLVAAAGSRPEARNRRWVINSAARRCGGSRREGGNPGSHGPFRWVGRSRWGRWGCGLSAPSGFLGGGFFEGSGGSPGKGGSGEEVGAGRRLTLRFQLSPPHPTFQNGPLDPLTRDSAQAEPCLSSLQKLSLRQALQASNSSAAARLTHVAGPVLAPGCHSESVPSPRLARPRRLEKERKNPGLDPTGSGPSRTRICPAGPRRKPGAVTNLWTQGGQGRQENPERITRVGAPHACCCYPLLPRAPLILQSQASPSAPPPPWPNARRDPFGMSGCSGQWVDRAVECRGRGGTAAEGWMGVGGGA
ncbi:uncharacterized protein LOC116658821 [Camelus ferus]|uniref:Uncharacterized protein LOC116658821 n=1 Tax=Camelus ferus TaxID=419612 RepID=A0A8B8RRT2_CAMFR|nr:uncharacterized protein LOC116658821 [Camelus ferus]